MSTYAIRFDNYTVIISDSIATMTGFSPLIGANDPIVLFIDNYSIVILNDRS